MILCHCAVVSSGDIATAVGEGACTVSEVCRRTGAAQTCGTCVFSIREVVCQNLQPRVVEAQEALHAAG